jgi:hypothetical protein
MRLTQRKILPVLLVALAFGGCGSDDDGAGSGGGEGAECTDGTNCAQGLVCLVMTNDPAAGVCTKAPAACGSDLSCDCLDELKSHCTSPTHCLGILGNYVLACGQDGYRLEGETCSAVRYCDSGLYCMVAKPGAPGTCIKNPVACGTQPSCACFEEVQQTCPSGVSCSVLGDKSVISCH